MNRRVALVIAAAGLLTLIASGGVARVARRSSVAPTDTTANPAHFVASDVSLLGSTGRPQLVEVFHYG